MDGLELYDRLRPLHDAAADNAYMLGDERERGMYDGYGEVMRRCLELPQADVEDWIYGFTHAIRESGDADTEYARDRGIAMDCARPSKNAWERKTPDVNGWRRPSPTAPSRSSGCPGTRGWSARLQRSPIRRITTHHGRHHIQHHPVGRFRAGTHGLL